MIGNLKCVRRLPFCVLFNDISALRSGANRQRNRQNDASPRGVGSLGNNQFAAQCLCHFADGLEPRVAVFGQGFVQAGASNSGLFGHFGHTHCAGRDVQGMDKIGFVSGGSNLLEKRTDFFGSVQVFRDVEGFRRCHSLVLQFVQDLHCLVNVLGLRGLAATDQQKDHRTVPDRVVNSEAGAEKEAQFEKMVSNLFKIPEVAVFYPAEPRQDSDSYRRIF